MYKNFILDNGLRVVVEDIEYVNSVSVGLWIENGSRNEDKHNNGISHFIEHMLFKGTKKRNAKQIAESIEDVGGQINAFTGKETTCFYVKVLDTHLELSFDILSDMIFNSVFNYEDIEKEKGVIIEEINMSEDLPEDVLSDLHSKAIWGDDPISMPILGTIETVKSFSQKQLLEYLHSYYIPENCVLSIAGKISTNNIENLVNKYFGKWPYYKSKTITQYTYPKILKNHLFKQKDIEQLHINLGINGLEIGNDDIYSLLILNNMFGGGASSILFQKIREELGICYSIYSYISSFKNTGIISIYTSLNPRYSNQVIELIKKEIYKFSNLSITNDKLIKLKEQLKGSYILGLESTSSRMFSNGKSMLFFNKIDTPEDIIKKIDIITIENLNNVMEKTFKKGIQNSAFVGESVNLDSIINIIKG
ncbi:Predicted Zn-dependent peptidase [Clostridium sp. USBA 49]|jgi:predicted Zn-dependent peptidase|uniref:M16 family metallopeptidase n=1 Tax=Clostridium TaxID=1485 RepID=UPI00099A3CF5|nr:MULTISPECIES: pitrilysin family protein [Clostridium]SKA76527.1 Predicted Zn-dependent peptidase [Clostridium sp. USBA 49]